MTRRLWSLNALATELGRDRRTIAKALRDVPADGRLSGAKPWFLETTLKALERMERPTAAPIRADPLLEHFVWRVRDWRELCATDCRGMPLSIGGAAHMTGFEAEQILTWLRAGMRFIEQGDWETGQGFVLNSGWLIDWAILLRRAVVTTGDQAAAHELRIEW